MGGQGLSSLLSPLILVWIALFIVAVWFAIDKDGWRLLKARYRTEQAPAGQEWRWQNGKIGWTDYTGSLTLTANDEGLFIEASSALILGHPRLFIPWSDFYEAKVQNSLLQREVRAKVGLPAITDVTLPAEVFEQSAGRRVLETP